MGRIKGIKNLSSFNRPMASTLSSAERITLLANLIIDRIIEDQQNNKILFKKITDK